MAPMALAQERDLADPRTLRIRNRAKKVRDEESVSPLIAEACAGIDELLQAAEAGESLEGLCTVRTRKLELKPREYGPKEVRAVRMKLKASQALLARFMGVNNEASQFLGAGKEEGATDGPSLS
ncbi:MAG: hypothetical protein ACXU95_18415 [Isosphaeraceae bacterium]